MKRMLIVVTTVLVLSTTVSFADAADEWVPDCKQGFSVMSGGKTVNFTNKTQYKETMVVNLISASWDEAQKRWANGKTYTLTLTADPGESVHGLLSYQGCGAGRNYAAAILIGITGMTEWLYEMTDNDPYAPGELGNSNSIINVVSDEYNNYQATFSN